MHEQDSDPHNLSRFVEAQSQTYEQALAEIRQGRKRGHWMWFIFPQLHGLGHSSMAQRYAIKGIDEAQAYLSHDLLGPRLAEISTATLGVDRLTATDIFGTPDDLKLRSCATLFAHVSDAGSVFDKLLEKYFDEQQDPRTCQLLRTISQGKNA